MSIFSERLKWLRERKGFTQKEMSDKLGMSGSSYSKYEYGLREPNIETLSKLPGILGESLDFLLGVDDHLRIHSAHVHLLENKVGHISAYYEKIAHLMTRDKDGEEEPEKQIEFLNKTISRIKEESDKISDLLLKDLNEIPLVKEETLDHIRTILASYG